MVFINHSKKIIFIHITKTGGMTIKKTFNKHNIKNDIWDDLKAKENSLFHTDHELIKYLFTINKYNLNETNLLSNLFIWIFHLTMNDLKIIYSKEFNDYFKFTFVRNPYDRVYSFYEYISKDKFTQSVLRKIYLYYTIFAVPISFLLKNIYRKIFIFANLILFLFIMNIDYKLTSSFSSFIKNFELLKMYPSAGIKSQYDFIKNNKMNFIGKQENFNYDFQKLLKKLNLPNKIINKNVINSNDFKNYKYIDKFTRNEIDFINRIYHEDFVYFGYKKL